MRREGERGGEHVCSYCETFLEGEEKEGGVSFGVDSLFFRLKEEGGREEGFLTWPGTQSGWTSLTIQWRKGARMGVCELGASGSAMMRVYLVVVGSRRWRLEERDVVAIKILREKMGESIYQSRARL